MYLKNMVDSFRILQNFCDNFHFCIRYLFLFYFHESWFYLFLVFIVTNQTSNTVFLLFTAFKCVVLVSMHFLYVKFLKLRTGLRTGNCIKVGGKRSSVYYFLCFCGI